MLFHEIYGAYFNTVSQIIKKAVSVPVTDKDIRELISQYAFSESMLSIETALKEQHWQLLKRDGTTPIKNEPDISLTLLQKRWLKAILLDPRIQLFDCDFSFLDDTEPLFTNEDYYIFDKYADGDDFENENYIRNFRTILKAVHEHTPLSIEMTNKKGNTLSFDVIPEYLEYSEKDDKFRLLTSGNRHVSVINLGRIISCKPYEGKAELRRTIPEKPHMRSVTLELYDERNALERVMLHFSHFEKEAEKISDNLYRVKIHYEQSDETEMVIRVLSFGPMVKVTAPAKFVGLIKGRLRKQKSCGL